MYTFPMRDSITPTHPHGQHRSQSEVRQIKLHFHSRFRVSELHVMKYLSGLPLHLSGAPGSVEFMAFLYASNGKAYPGKASSGNPKGRFRFTGVPPYLPQGICTIIEAQHPDYQFRNANLILRHNAKVIVEKEVRPMQDVVISVPEHTTSIVVKLGSIANVISSIESP